MNPGEEGALATLFALSPAAMYVVDEEARIRAANEAAVALFGYPSAELLGLSLDALRVEGHPAPGIDQVRRRDGSTLEVVLESRAIQWSGKPAHLVVIRDVTESRARDAASIEARKMASLARFGGAVVHDVNNMLSVILSYADFLVADLGAGHSSLSDAEEVRRAGKRLAELMQRLMAFSKQAAPTVTPLELHAQLDASAARFAELAGDKVQIQNERRATRTRVEIDPAIFANAVGCLIENAREAMPEGGTITIETRDADVTEREAELHAGAKPGRYVVVAVVDQGAGMDEAVRAQAFEPFFTTKARGKGIGLGLPTVHGFARGAGGHVRLSTEKGRGTTVAIYLPAG